MLKNKLFYASCVAAVAVSGIVLTEVAEASVNKPYESATIIEEYGYVNVRLEGLSGPVLIKHSSEYEVLMYDDLIGLDINHALQQINTGKFYIQLLSPDKKHVYDSILVDSTTLEATYDYDIDQPIDSNDMFLRSFGFNLGEVVFLNDKTTRVTFNSVHTRMGLYDFNNPSIRYIEPTSTPITLDLPASIYATINLETREYAELFIKDATNYSFNPMHSVYSYYDYNFLSFDANEDLSERTKVNLVELPVPYVTIAPVENRGYIDKTIEEIAAEKYIDLTKASFSDVGKSSHTSSIQLLSSLKIINGYTDGSFKPNNKLRYSDVIKLLGRFEGLELLPQAAITPQMKAQYNTEDAEVISYLKQLPSLFTHNMPYQTQMTRGQFAETYAALLQHQLTKNNITTPINDIVAAQNFESTYTVKDPKYKDAVTLLDYFGITVIENGQFNDDQSLSRAQFASFLARMYRIDFDAVQ